MSLEIPEIRSYRQRWLHTTREHILPKRTDEQFEQEGKLQAEALQEFIDPAWDVLDYGSGIGRVIRNIDAATRYALDVNYASLKQTPEGIIRLHSDGRTIPLPDNSVDFIYSLMVLQHCTKSHHRSIFAEMVRVLKPNREALIQLPKDNIYYIQSTGVNVYTQKEVESYVPEGADYDLSVGELVRYADGVHKDREWWLKLRKA